jgi:hypothetical protein
MMHWSVRKREHARLLQLAADEEMSADAAARRGDDILLIDAHRRRAEFFRQRAIIARGDTEEVPD